MGTNGDLSFYFRMWAIPVGEESALDSAEALAPLGVVHIDVGTAWRSEEAVFRDFSCKTHISRSFGRPCFFKFHSTANGLHAVLVAQFHAFPSPFLFF